MANLMISSVPGPPIPLWLSGHRVASAAPVGPLFGIFSLNITVLGFEDHLEFGLLGCAETMHDLLQVARPVDARGGGADCECFVIRALLGSRSPLIWRFTRT